MQFRHVYMNFRQNFSQNKIYFRHFRKKTLAETVNCIPKGLRKGNPFHGPFAQLSCICNTKWRQIRQVFLLNSVLRGCIKARQKAFFLKGWASGNSQHELSMEQVFGAELLLIAMRSQDLPLHLPLAGKWQCQTDSQVQICTKWVGQAKLKNG